MNGQNTMIYICSSLELEKGRKEENKTTATIKPQKEK
jgi:hypothetical protein